MEGTVLMVMVIMFMSILVSRSSLMVNSKRLGFFVIFLDFGSVSTDVTGDRSDH